MLRYVLIRVEAVIIVDDESAEDASVVCPPNVYCPPHQLCWQAPVLPPGVTPAMAAFHREHPGQN